MPKLSTTGIGLDTLETFRNLRVNHGWPYIRLTAGLG